MGVNDYRAVADYCPFGQDSGGGKLERVAVEARRVVQFGHVGFFGRAGDQGNVRL
jgi:hypothetical protein